MTQAAAHPPIQDVLPSRAMDLTRVRVVVGRAAVLAYAAQLEELAGASGQPGAMHGLQYVLDHEHAARKTPHLVTFLAADGALSGAVLLFEYHGGRWPTGLFSTGDSFGVRTVVGPATSRASLAAAAASTLLAARARMVLISFRNTEDASGPLLSPDLPKRVLWASQTRIVQDRLPLAPTFDGTLAHMGKRTRTHLRYYRRRLEEGVPCKLVADAVPFIDPADEALLAELNRRSLDPISQAGFNLQYRAAAAGMGGFVTGLRARSGEWLALAGGWRQDDTTWIQWQTNASGYASLSVGTAFRSFLIEQEVARGMKWLGFHGGTSHSMHHAFPPEPVVDLLARRPGSLPAVLTRLVTPLYRLLPLLAARGNFLADALASDSLHWSSSPAASFPSSTTPIRRG